MGHFSTRDEAQRWVKILLPHYPDAFVDEMRKLIPHSDVQDLLMEQDADGLCQSQRTTLNTRTDLS